MTAIARSNFSATNLTRCRVSQFSIATGVVITEPVWKVAPITRLPYACAKSAVGVRGQCRVVATAFERDLVCVYVYVCVCVCVCTDVRPLWWLRAQIVMLFRLACLRLTDTALSEPHPPSQDASRY
jgi:hypothetical protein